MEIVLRPFFFFNDTATTEIYTLSLHDALPISDLKVRTATVVVQGLWALRLGGTICQQLKFSGRAQRRSEEHTSELQSRPHLVCRLLLEKKKIAYPSRLQWSLWRLCNYLNLTDR